jgi:hypothetical protein
MNTPITLHLYGLNPLKLAAPISTIHTERFTSLTTRFNRLKIASSISTCLLAALQNGSCRFNQLMSPSLISTGAEFAAKVEGNPFQSANERLFHFYQQLLELSFGKWFSRFNPPKIAALFFTIIGYGLIITGWCFNPLMIATSFSTRLYPACSRTALYISIG